MMADRILLVVTFECHNPDFDEHAILHLASGRVHVIADDDVGLNVARNCENDNHFLRR